MQIMISRHPDLLFYPTPHTSALPDEKNGEHFIFVTNEEMVTDIRAGKYLDHGTFNGAIYGIKIDTIRRVHSAGRTAVLDVEPQALKVLCTAEFSPYVVFIAPPPLTNHADYDRPLAVKARNSEQLQRTYGQYFDITIVNYDHMDSVAQIEAALVRLRSAPAPPQRYQCPAPPQWCQCSAQPQWCPCSGPPHWCQISAPPQRCPCSAAPQGSPRSASPQRYQCLGSTDIQTKSLLVLAVNVGYMFKQLE